MSVPAPVPDWDPIDPRVTADPSAAYAELRERCPVAYSDRWGGFWALTRYQDIVEVAANHEAFISSVQNLVPRSPRSGVPRRPLQVDPPEHAHFRRAMNPYFETDRVALLEPELRQTAARFAGPLVSRGGGDAMDEYARHLPIRALCAFLRVPEEDAEFVQQRSGRYVEAIAADDHERAAELSAELDEYARRLVFARQAAPLDPAVDLVSGLLAATIDGRANEPEVIAGLVRGLIVAADRSTANGIGSAIMCLAEHPDLQDRLRHAPAGIPDAIEELLRLYAPSQATARTATREVVIGGRTIRAGEVVAMVFLAGNRDPAAFPSPDECTLERTPNRHLGFGHGVHKCAGRSLARLQLRVAIEELLGRTHGFGLDGPVSFNTWPEFGPRTLPLRIAS